MIPTLEGRFRWEPGQVRISLCASCVHKRKGPTCEAYPDGIPQPFLTGAEEHRQPHKDDHGIQYKKA